MRHRERIGVKGSVDDGAATQLAEFKSPLDKKYHRERGVFVTWKNKSVSMDGLLNLMFMASSFACVGILLENINKYGFRVSLTDLTHATDARKNVAGFYPTLLLFIFMPAQIFAALGIEKSIARQLVSEPVGLGAHAANFLWHFVYPILGIWMAGDSISILGGCWLCLVNVMVLLKLWSFAHTCWWARDKQRNAHGVCRHVAEELNNDSVSGAAASGAILYPHNLTVANLAYFIVAPTLCYEMDYPRKPSTNWRNVALRVAMLFLALALDVAIVQQGAVPMCVATAAAFAILGHTLLQLFFFKIFHVYVVLCAELTRFADFHFYENWWDSENVSVFWRRWNLPVYRWCSRHVYKPLRCHGYSQTTGRTVVFAISGVFHEYVLSSPTRIFRIYATVAFLGQVPLFNVTEWISRNLGPRWGNAFVWFTIVIFAPLAVVLHVHDYQVAFNGPNAFDTVALSFGR